MLIIQYTSLLFLYLPKTPQALVQKPKSSATNAPSVNQTAFPYSALVTSRYLFLAMPKRAMSMIQTTNVESKARSERRVMKMVPER